MRPKSLITPAAGAVLAVLIAGCFRLPSDDAAPGAPMPGPSTPASAQSLEGQFSYDQMDRYLNAVTPMITEWVDATWDGMPNPSRVVYVPHGGGYVEDQRLDFAI